MLLAFPLVGCGQSPILGLKTVRGDCWLKFQGTSPAYGQASAMSADGKMLALAVTDDAGRPWSNRRILIFEIDTLKERSISLDKVSSTAWAAVTSLSWVDKDSAIMYRAGNHLVRLQLSDLSGSLMAECANCDVFDIAADGRYARVGNSADGRNWSLDTTGLAGTPGKKVVLVGMNPKGVSWSPSGRYVAVSADLGSASGPGYAVFLVDLSIDPPHLGVLHRSVDRQVAWTDESHVVLVDYQGGRVYQVNALDESEMVVVDLGRDPTLLTGAGGDWPTNPQLSSDGTRLSFATAQPMVVDVECVRRR